MTTAQEELHAQASAIITPLNGDSAVPYEQQLYYLHNAIRSIVNEIDRCRNDVGTDEAG
jgi:hypothetical protein